jgi:hypothetical protein
LRNLLRRFLARQPTAARPEEPQLTGAPARLRLKTYSSEEGMVYQYLYRGHRAEQAATTYVFSVTINRKDWERVSVALDRKTIEDWQQANDHTLRGVDLYAIAKMSLFESFDRSGEGVPSSVIQPDSADISRLLDGLGLL